MATMKEIAELAGVSRGTVDRVINNRGSVNPQTEKKIKEIIEMLNYEPNKAGIALAAQKKNLTIGVVLFGKGNAFFDDVVTGLEQKVEDLKVYGIGLIVRRIPFDLDLQLAEIDKLVNKEHINGLLLSPYNDERVRERIDELWEAGIPCVTTNTDIPESKRIAYVGSDFYKCGQTAAALMRMFTHKALKIGIVTGSHNVLCHEDRIRGFVDSMKETEANYPMEIVDIIEAHDDDYESYDAVNSLLTRFPDIDAIYYTASGMYGGCRRLLGAQGGSEAAGRNSVNTDSHSTAFAANTGEQLRGVKGPLGQTITLIGFDSVATTLEMLQKGVITATITQQPELQGSLSLTILQDYLVSGILPENPIYHTELSVKIRECI